jgi:hypothetical protein
MTNLSDLFPAGAGKQVSFVASGTLSNGQAVALKTDGTVEAISATGGAGSSGTPTAATSSNIYIIRSTYDPDTGKVIIIYSDVANSSYGTYVVGTVSGTTITYGTPAVYVSYNTGSAADITYDTLNDKVVIVWRGSAGHGQAIVGTVSGTTISFGTQVEFAAATSNDTFCGFDSTNNKVLVCYADGGNSYYATAIVGTVSGTAISFGTEVQVFTHRWSLPQIAFDTALSKFCVAYKDWGNSYYATAVVLTISGTSVSAGSSTVVASINDQPVVAYDISSGKFALFHRNGSDGVGVVLSISGTSIVLGNSTTFDAGLTPYQFSCAYDGLSQTTLLAYVDNTATVSKYILATISGTTITFSTPVTFDTAVIGESPFGVVYDTASQTTVASYKGASSYLYSTVIKTTGSNNTSFIGITDAAISSAASGNVTIKGGISTNVTSLTPSSDYYAQADGTISTVSTSPAVKIGRAMSATSINLEYQS